MCAIATLKQPTIISQTLTLPIGSRNTGFTFLLSEVKVASRCFVTQLLAPSISHPTYTRTAYGFGPFGFFLIRVSKTGF